jgi:hypothetical protein
MGKTISSTLLPEFYKKSTKVTTVYDFSISAENDYRYIVNSESIAPYTATAIKRTAIKSEDGTIINELEIGLDNVDLSLRHLVMEGMLENKKCVVSLAFIRTYTNGQPPVIIGTVLLYEGYTDSLSGDQEWLSINIRPFPLLERYFPRRIYQTQCNWRFCDSYCGLSLSTYRNDVTLAVESDGVTFTYTHGRAVDYFVPGYIEILSGLYTGAVRPVLSNGLGDVIARIPFGYVLSVGTQVRFQKLCSKHVDACQDDFNNYLNYGGFPFMPKSPII